MKTFTCSHCGDSYDVALAKADHTYEAAVTAPTCTNNGYTTHTCSVCGDSYVDSIVPATGHSYEAVVTAPTCDKMGYTTYTCSVCGDSYVAATPMRSNTPTQPSSRRNRPVPRKA